MIDTPDTSTEVLEAVLAAVPDERAMARACCTHSILTIKAQKILGELTRAGRLRYDRVDHRWCVVAETPSPEAPVERRKKRKKPA